MNARSRARTRVCVDAIDYENKLIFSQRPSIHNTHEPGSRRSDGGAKGAPREGSNTISSILYNSSSTSVLLMEKTRRRKYRATRTR